MKPAQENQSVRFSASQQPENPPHESRHLHTAVEFLAQDRYAMSTGASTTLHPQFNELPERLKDHWRHQAWQILREVLAILGKPYGGPYDQKRTFGQLVAVERLLNRVAEHLSFEEEPDARTIELHEDVLVFRSKLAEGEKPAEAGEAGT